MLNKIREKLMLGKLYISRTTTYLSIINAGMILYLFLSKLKDTGVIHWRIESYAILIVVIGVFLLLFAGWIEIKFLRGIQKENEIGFTYTPQYVEMLDKINKIKEILEKKNNGNH